MLKNIPQDWQKILSSGEGGDDFIAALEKVSTFLNKEKQNGAVAVRNRKKGDCGVMSYEDFAQKLLDEIATKSMDM